MYKTGIRPPEISRKMYLKARYKISIEDYNKLFVLQYGKCAICKRHQSEFKRRLAVDHNHSTGKVRGLLCFRCNAHVLPIIEQSDYLIESAKTYLKEF